MPAYPSTLFTGRNVIWLDRVDSTNSYAAQFFDRPNVPEGTIVAAYEQTEGKGQRGNEWQSVAGLNLTFTLILTPFFIGPGSAFLLNIVASLAVLRLAEELTGGEIHVKWPNDVLLNQKKTAGILIENNLSGNAINKSFVGIGINLNQEKFPGLPFATSFKNETGTDYVIEDVLNSFCNLFEPLYLQLRSGSNEKLYELYRKKLFGINQWRKFESEGRQFDAKILGVESDGRLTLETKREKLSCNMQEVSYVF